jgi:hypothetical protein
LLVEAGWGASRTKNTYLRSKYESLVGRRGRKRALIAVGHKILCAAYFIIRNKEPYLELGAEYPGKRKRENEIQRLEAKLNELRAKAETAG